MATRTRKKDNTTSEVVGAGVGVAGGAATGAAIGTLAGPVGTAIGAVVGGVAGAFAGKAAADYIDPAVEEKYWEKNYTTRPYYKEGTTFTEYRPAYHYGVLSATKYPGKDFKEVESRLSRNWPKSRGDSSLTWSKARGPIQDAYDRTLRLYEERLNVGKEVETGEVDVHKETVTERKKIDVPVEREEVVIKRRPARGNGRHGAIGTEEKEIRIPVKEERVRVSKETVPTEEVTIEKRKVREVNHVDEPVRKEKMRTTTRGRAKVREEGSAN